MNWVERGRKRREDRGSNEHWANDDVTWRENCVQSDLVREGQCDLNFVWGKLALMRNVLGREWEEDVEVDLHGKHNLLEVLPLEKDSYTVVFVLDGAELHCDNRKEDSVIEGRIVIVEGDMVDSNVVDIDDEEDDEHDCEVADCSDLQVQNVDMEQHEDLVGRPTQHVLRSWHQDTFPLEDEYVSNVYPWWAERDRRTDAATEHNTK
jgi:hypothetical protein